MNLLKTLTVSIGWLSGSLAGLGAILYVTGAQTRLLGIDGIFTYSADYVVQEGARFVLVVGNLLLSTVLALAAFLACALVSILSAAFHNSGDVFGPERHPGQAPEPGRGGTSSFAVTVFMKRCTYSSAPFRKYHDVALGSPPSLPRRGGPGDTSPKLRNGVLS